MLVLSMPRPIPGKIIFVKEVCVHLRLLLPGSDSRILLVPLVHSLPEGDDHRGNAQLRPLPGTGCAKRCNDSIDQKEIQEVIPLNASG